MKCAVQIWSQIWQGGQDTPLLMNDNEKHRFFYIYNDHPGLTAACLRIRAGYRARILQGRGGDGVRCRWFETGDYYDLSWYENAWARGGDFVVEVETVTYPEEALTVMYDAESAYGEESRAEFAAWWKVGPGVHGKDRFPPNRVSTMKIPSFQTAWLHRVPDLKDERPVELIGPGLYHLRDFGIDDAIESAEIKPDDLEYVGTEFEIVEKEVKETSLMRLVLPLNESDVDVTINQQLTADVSLSHSEQWDVRAGVTATAGVEAEAGAFFAKAKVTASVSVSVEGGYGQSTDRTESVSRSAGVEATVPPGQGVVLTMTVDKMAVKMKAVRTWRSVRTGAEVVEDGWIVDENASEARVIPQSYDEAPPE